MSYLDIRKLLLIVGLGVLGPCEMAWSRSAASTAAPHLPQGIKTTFTKTRADRDRIAPRKGARTVVAKGTSKRGAQPAEAPGSTIHG